MNASIGDVCGDILLKFKKFLVEEGENDISVSGPHKFIYEFAYNVGAGHGSNKGNSVIDLITVEVPAAPETGNDILINSDVKIGCSMLYMIQTLMLGMGRKEPWLLP